jgi:dihydrofolate synthase/folylpolyglutamate synthase
MQLAKTPAGQVVLLDGAHNAASAAALRNAFGKSFPGIRPALVLGVLADKDWRIIVATLAPLAGRILLAPVNSARTLPPVQLAAACREAAPGVAVEVCASLQEALEHTASEAFLLITGSLYLVGEAMAQLQLLPATRDDERKLNEWGGTPGITR